jgi:hypothetical protein
MDTDLGLALNNLEVMAAVETNENNSTGNLLDDMLHNRTKPIPFWGFFLLNLCIFFVGLACGYFSRVM